jgi:GTP-binding protein
MKTQQLRNVAIIAHVDHGKTTLVDHLLKQAHTFAAHQAEMHQDTILDSQDLERERGVTILAKNTAIVWNDYKINILDTPGHADFSGEVERVLTMAEGCLLLVDAAEGVLSQTRYVLALALKLKLKPIVIVNKVDRKDQRVEAVVNEITNLFLDLAETPEQLDFPLLYAVGKLGVVGTKLAPNPDHSLTVTDATDLSLLFKTIVDAIPAPTGDPQGPFQMQITTLDYDSHKGRYVIGKITRGTIRTDAPLAIMREQTRVGQARVEYLFTFKGLKKETISEAQAGDIVAVCGFSDARIGDTLADPDKPEGLPHLPIAQPTLKIQLSASTSPFVGRDGKFTTSRQISNRLKKEIETNVGLQISPGPTGDSFTVAGRGELHLSILIETMRREGFEFSVSRPEVIFRQIDGVTQEPFETVFIEVPQTYSGLVINTMGQRKAEMVNMDTLQSGVRFTYKMATRHLIGLRNEFLTLTSGLATINAEFAGYQPKGPDLPFARNGVVVAHETGQALGYAIENLQKRATSFVNPGEEVYKSMIVGLNSRQDDMVFNICKGKKLTNMRAATADTTIRLTPATKMSLEQCLTFLGPDELLEVTPKHLRLRKKTL